jgi:LuxR family quorum sensing-dependent transcriptional regulator
MGAPLAADYHNIARQAFDFIAEVERLTTQPAVIARLDRELVKFGFNAWVITGLPVPGEHMRDKMLLNGWHPEWSRLYLENNYALEDPVAQECFRSKSPFEWNDVHFDAKEKPKAKLIMDGATEFQMRNGFCVPIHTLFGFQAVVSMGGEYIDVRADAKRALHIMSIFAYQKAVDVVRPQTGPKPILTRRERDILSWTAAGKSAWDISRILGISEYTVKEHLQNIARKFGTPNKVSTVVEALRRREIYI